MPNPNRLCCKPECNKLAEYEVWFGPAPDQYTEACFEHITNLMTDAYQHTITKIVEQVDAKRD